MKFKSFLYHPTHFSANTFRRIYMIGTQFVQAARTNDLPTLLLKIKRRTGAYQRWIKYEATCIEKPNKLFTPISNFLLSRKPWLDFPVTMARSRSDGCRLTTT